MGKTRRATGRPAESRRAVRQTVRRVTERAAGLGGSAHPFDFLLLSDLDEMESEVVAVDDYCGFRIEVRAAETMGTTKGEGV